MDHLSRGRRRIRPLFYSRSRLRRQRRLFPSPAEYDLPAHCDPLRDAQKRARPSQWDIFKKIRLPNSLPYMFAGIKVALVLSVTGAIVAEFVAANQGLGYLILQANYSLDTAFALVILLILALLSLALFWLIDVV